MLPQARSGCGKFRARALCCMLLGLPRLCRNHVFRTLNRRAFTVLAIESSADDTCAAVVCSDRKILSNVVMKQNNLFGFILWSLRKISSYWFIGMKLMEGFIHSLLLRLINAIWCVVSSQLCRMVCKSNLTSGQPLAVQAALREAQVDIVKDVDGIAFTRGPGIGGCLSVGSNAAKTLAAALGKPLVGVHHMVRALYLF